MELTVNRYGKPFWIGVNQEDLIFEVNFHKVDLSLKSDDFQVAFHCSLGSITILDRMTGYGSGLRDVETGFRDVDGNFWLASGMFDIRKHLPMKFSEAVALIKKNANNCFGG